MAELVHEFEHPMVVDGGRNYRVRALAESRGHVWIGWLEFADVGAGEVLRTPEETSQPSRKAVEYWASGLEPVYLEGALARAR